MSETRDHDSCSGPVNGLIDGFRKLWQSATSPPSLARYFQNAQPAKGEHESDSDSGFTELLSIDIAARQQNGFKASLSDYEADFPDRVDIIRSILGSQHIEAPIPMDSNSTSVTVRISPADADETHSIDRHTDNVVTDAILTRIGRYDVERVLGSGGFGRVYLARDPELHRHVAIKVPHQHRIQSSFEVEEYLAEARTLARLEHSGVVPIYDFDRLEDRCYVVSKYVEGESLAQRQRRSPLPLNQVIPSLCDLARTLEYVHSMGVVHRDIKPGNLLVSQNERFIVTDFGLALRDFDTSLKPGLMGTINYMSPEQARGETHLVDGRSDLFSVGIVMYELLTGTRPFFGDNWQQTIVMICDKAPISPRQQNVSIPRELERICMKLLSKRATDRYASGHELADDLQHFMADSPELTGAAPLFHGTTATSSWKETSQQLVGIIPRGLRSFGIDDSVFFRHLLPGPRNRDGIPNSLAVWKQRCEEPRRGDSFRVGMIYGPSGSGKSSFMKAGLLPLLDSRLTVAFVEAAAQGTASRIVQTLRQRCPDMPTDLSLKESLAWIRHTRQEATPLNVVLIIDQFEQWLHAWDGDSSDDFCLALRQCDGLSLRTILLVRDDFWLPASRFADAIEVELVPGQNLGIVDLFDKRHARKVLAEYGGAYGRLPTQQAEMSSAQSNFLTKAVEDLADGDRVIPIQLAAFSEIMKTREWNAKSLHSLGGVKGVGAQFLEESFRGSRATAQHRSFEKAAQAVLRCLLPEAGTNIKGAMQSETKLRVVSGHETSPRMFDQLMRILDTELRLVTPASIEVSESDWESNDSGSSGRHYQLTHDFLVPEVRAWLNRRQAETLSGRTNLRLIDRTEVWTARPTSQHLPSCFEWLSFLALTRRTNHDSSQQRMMAAAAKRHTVGLGLLTMLCVCLLAGGIAWNSYLRTSAAIEQLLTAESGEVTEILDRLQGLNRWSGPRLSRLAADNAAETTIGLRSRFGLLRNDGNRQSLRDEVFQQRNTVSLETLLSLSEELSKLPAREKMVAELWSALEPDSGDSEFQWRSALLLAQFDPPSLPGSKLRWQKVGDNVMSAIIQQLRADPRCYVTLTEALMPIRKTLLPPLRQLLNSRSAPTADKDYALNLIIDFLKDNPNHLADVYLDATANQVSAIGKILHDSFPEIRGTLMNAFLAEPEILTSAETQEHIANRQANAAAMLLFHQNFDGAYNLLRHSEIPNTRSKLIERTRQLQVSQQLMLDELIAAKDCGVVSGLLLALGSAATPTDSPEQTPAVLPQARLLFETHPSADVHSAAEWALRQCRDQDWLNQARDRLAGQPRLPDQTWEIDANGLTLIDVQLPDQTISISSHEVMIGQYQEFKPDYKFSEIQAPFSDCPTIQASWFQAVDYCRWLTEQAGMTEEDQCYPSAEQRTDDLMPYADYRQRRGYRLPTITDFQAAYFGDVQTRFHFGHDARLLPKYDSGVASYHAHLERCGTRKPSHQGFFNLDGNVAEWCTPGPYHSNAALRPVFGGKIDGTAFYATKLHNGGNFTTRTRFYTVGFRVMRIVERPAD